jgi:hypothetical protein
MGGIQWSFVYKSFPLKVVSYIWREFVSNIYYLRGRRGRDSIVVGFPTTCAISVYHYQVVNSNPVHAEVYSMQHYVIKFVSDLRHVGGFLCVFQFPTPTDRHDIIEMLLKVALNTLKN